MVSQRVGHEGIFDASQPSIIEIEYVLQYEPLIENVGSS